MNPTQTTPAADPTLVGMMALIDRAPESRALVAAAWTSTMTPPKNWAASVPVSRGLLLSTENRQELIRLGMLCKRYVEHGLPSGRQTQAATTGARARLAVLARKCGLSEAITASINAGVREENVGGGGTQQRIAQGNRAGISTLLELSAAAEVAAVPFRQVVREAKLRARRADEAAAKQKLIDAAKAKAKAGAPA